MNDGLATTLSEVEAVWIVLTTVSLGLWLWDAVSAAQDWRAQPPGDVREVAAFILTIRLGWAWIQLVFLLAGLAAAATPPQEGVPAVTAGIRNGAAILTQIGSISVALWARGLRMRGGASG